MAFNEHQAQRIRDSLLLLNVEFSEKKMFGGICFLVDNKMICGTHIDKESGDSFLLCRISEDEGHKALELPYVQHMNFTGKPMKGYIFVTEAGIETKNELTKWLKLCLEFNPFAKKSKK